MRVVDNYPIPGRHTVYNVDDDWDLAALYERSKVPPTMRQVIPRDFAHKPVGALEGIPEAGPIMESMDVLVPWDKIKEVIAEAHAMKLFPVYHAYKTWAPNDGSFVWTQNGLGFCWTWGGTAEFMTLRAVLGMRTVFLAPVSMGYLVNWNNQGNYLESWLRGAMDDGIVPVRGGELSLDEWPDVSINSTNRSSRFWGEYDQWRPHFRLDRVWDINTRSGEQRNIQECLTALKLSCPLYVAHNWWGHALGIEAMFWDTSAPNNVTFGHRNSHGEKDLIILEGSRGTPDEAYPFLSVKPGDY